MIENELYSTNSFIYLVMQHKSREKFQIFKTLSHMHTPTVDPIKNRSQKKQSDYSFISIL